MRVIADSAPVRRLREYNQCHGPQDGKFCSDPQGASGGGSLHPHPERYASQRRSRDAAYTQRDKTMQMLDRAAKIDPQKRLDYATDRIDKVQDYFAGQQPPQSPESGYDAFVAKSVQNMQATSRTAKGVSDTSSSADKPKLNTEGDALAAKADTNFRNALSEAWNAKDHQFQTPDEVVQFAEHIASTVSDGLLQPGQDLYRTWETKNKQALPADIKPQMQAFGQALFNRLQNDRDPVGTAAWVEKEMAYLHPWADGVGRTTKVLSAYVLARAGLELPTYPDKKTYYNEVLKSAPEWDAYFRSMFKGQPSAKKPAAKVSPNRLVSDSGANPFSPTYTTPFGQKYDNPAAVPLMRHLYGDDKR